MVQTTVLSRIGGALGLTSHGIAILAIFKHKTDPCFLALTPIFNLAAPLLKIIILQLNLACRQALQGTLAAGQEKERVCNYISEI